MNLSEFTNIYSLNKTLKFRLIPQWQTEKNFEKDVLDADLKRNESYPVIKKLMDSCHKEFIDNCLDGFGFPNNQMERYFEVYSKGTKSKEEKDELYEISKELREIISKRFTADAKYKTLFSANDIGKNLLEYAETSEEKEALKRFDQFYTYFSGFFSNRENMYTSDNKSTSIAYRVINQNLPKFCFNIGCWNKIKEAINVDDLDRLRKDYKEKLNINVDSYFDIKNYDFAIRQSDIDLYNCMIGGYTINESTKVKGINEYVNLFNQNSDGTKLPSMQVLYKQILSDRNTLSFVPQSFTSDKEVLNTLKILYNGFDNKISLRKTIENIENLFKDIDQRNADYILIRNDGSLTSVSNILTGSWSTIIENLREEYDTLNPDKKHTEKYLKDREKELKNISSLSLSRIDGLLNEQVSTAKTLSIKCLEITESVKKAYEALKPLLNNEYPEDRKLAKDKDSIEFIKRFLDSLKEAERFVGLFYNDDIATEKDEEFHSNVLYLLDDFQLVTEIYNKTRNYLTKKPYSIEKIKINFNNPTLLNGWDRNKEIDNSCVLLRNGRYYYLGVLKKGSRKIFECNYESSNGNWEKMIYKQIPSASKYFSSKQIYPANPPENIREYLDKNFDKKKMTHAQLEELITYVADVFIPNYEPLHDENGNCYFDFKFKPYSEYGTWNEFCKDIDKQSYSVKFKRVEENYIKECVENGELYLFQIYSKDFSEYSKGKKNLHTMYFESLFTEENLSETIYKLNGFAEVFMRNKSLDLNDTTVHSANNPIKNKTNSTGKDSSVFKYDIVKDRRFTERQFFLHFPITMNPNKTDKIKVGSLVNLSIRSSDDIKIIGIDRGERNLLYISVIDKDGKIIEQRSLNRIIAEGSKSNYMVDYHELLDKKEREREISRQEWNTIEGIKDLKEGYISQTVHVITDLVQKYNAIIAMEDLNSGFKNSRVKVEKQVYQKFEKMLIEKLNYMVDKNKKSNEDGGILHAYQLTDKFESFEKIGRQNGIIFYVPAWLTSKIDPMTGFVDLLHPKYTSVNNSKEFIKKIDAIRYNKEDDLFEFDFDFAKFERTDADFIKHWSVCTFGDRIKTIRNSSLNQWTVEKVNLTNEMKKLLKKFSIVIENNIKEQILQMDSKDFFEPFIGLIALTMQMRNSISGTDTDYLVSPVRNKMGHFYCSEDRNNNLPIDADANGAYHIALKALWAVNEIKNCKDSELSKVKLSISNAQWLEYAQKRV